MDCVPDDAAAEVEQLSTEGLGSVSGVGHDRLSVMVPDRILGSGRGPVSTPSAVPVEMSASGRLLVESGSRARFFCFSEGRWASSGR